MDDNSFNIWKNNYEIVDKAYSLDNYKIIDSDLKGRYCYVFCSSNGLWYPNEENVFEETIFLKNRYEWEKSTCINAGKIIYVRDIYKSWYVTGINSYINDIDKLAELIDRVSDGMPLIFVGVSSGGYLAVALTCLCKAEYALAFSPQFELCNEWCKESNFFLKKYEKDIEKNKYYSLKKLLMKNDSPIFYVCPYNSDQDRYQCKYIENVDSVKILKIKSDCHGIVIPPSSINEYLSLNKNQLLKIYNKFENKVISILFFQINLLGIRKTSVFYLKQIAKTIIKIVRHNG